MGIWELLMLVWAWLAIFTALMGIMVMLFAVVVTWWYFVARHIVKSIVEKVK